MAKKEVKEKKLKSDKIDKPVKEKKQANKLRGSSTKFMAVLC
jgi:hypothetical protein